MHPYSDTGCEIVCLCVKPCQMCCVQTRTALPPSEVQKTANFKGAPVGLYDIFWMK
jgi:hypothetical protein